MTCIVVAVKHIKIQPLSKNMYKKHKSSKSGQAILNQTIVSNLCEPARDYTLPTHELNVEILTNNENVKNIIDMFSKNFVKFQTEMHSKHNFARKDVEFINMKVKDLVIEPLLDVFRSFGKKLSESGELQQYNSIINDCSKILETCNTEYLLYKELKRKDLVQDLSELDIDISSVAAHKKGKLTYLNKTTKISTIPMQFSFRKVLERNDILLSMISFMKDAKESSSFQNIIQGELWEKKSKLYPDRLLIPYYLYSDDIEVNNPLGSHSTACSICNFYFSFPCLPEDTKLNKVFFVGAIKSVDIKKFGYKKCLKPIISEMLLLETDGLDIRMSNGEVYHPHFIPLLVLGDNLGLNNSNSRVC